ELVKVHLQERAAVGVVAVDAQHLVLVAGHQEEVVGQRHRPGGVAHARVRVHVRDAAQLGPLPAAPSRAARTGQDHRQGHHTTPVLAGVPHRQAPPLAPRKLFCNKGPPRAKTVLTRQTARLTLCGQTRRLSLAPVHCYLIRRSLSWTVTLTKCPTPSWRCSRCSGTGARRPSARSPPRCTRRRPTRSTPPCRCC